MVGVNIGLTKLSGATLGSQTLDYRAVSAAATTKISPCWTRRYCCMIGGETERASVRLAAEIRMRSDPRWRVQGGVRWWGCYSAAVL
jgi:hypothetical protein